MFGDVGKDDAKEEAWQRGHLRPHTQSRDAETTGERGGAPPPPDKNALGTAGMHAPRPQALGLTRTTSPDRPTAKLRVESEVPL